MNLELETCKATLARQLLVLVAVFGYPFGDGSRPGSAMQELGHDHGQRAKAEALRVRILVAASALMLFSSMN